MSVPCLQARRHRSVRLDRLVKAKYSGLEGVRERHGHDAAMEEFCLRRLGEARYGSAAQWYYDIVEHIG